MGNPSKLPDEKRSTSGSLSRRSSPNANSPEFEFCRLGNPSQPSLDLISADELFLDGVLLPLNLLHITKPYPDPDFDAESSTELELESNEAAATNRLTPTKQETGSGSGFGPEIARESIDAAGFTASKRWRDIIFKKSEKKGAKEKEGRKRENKGGRVTSAGSDPCSGTAELNINIWPFSRSRSAGNNVTRPRTSFGGPTRKASSAPCSRSNSAGESKSRKWPNSPGRTGVHLGRNSPVWHINRNGSIRNGRKQINENRKGKSVIRTGDNNKAKVLNLNVPMCVGQRSRLSCRTDGSGNKDDVADDGSVGIGNSLFGLRNLFTKKVY